MNLEKIHVVVKYIKKKKEGIKMKKDELREVKTIGEGVGFERIRRITGYLVGTVDRFNNGKRAEEHDRVKHGIEGILDDSKKVA